MFFISHPSLVNNRYRQSFAEALTALQTLHKCTSVLGIPKATTRKDVLHMQGADRDYSVGLNTPPI